MAARGRHDDEVARRLHPGRQRVFDVVRVADVDVLVHHDDQVEVLERPERREDGVALQAVVLRRRLAHLHHRVEAVQSARRHLGVGHDRHRALQHLQQARLQHVFAQHDGLAAVAVDGVVDRPVAVGEGGDLEDRRRIGRREIADELAERAFGDGLVDQHAAFQHDLGLGRDQHVLRDAFHHRQRTAAKPAGDGDLVGVLGHLRAHGRRRIVQRQVGSDADRDRQRLALALGALEGEPQVPAVVELDAGTGPADELQTVIGRVVGAGVGIAYDHDPRGNKASRILRRVMERGQHARKVDVLGVDVLLRRRPLHQHRRLRRAERAADERPDAVEVDPEGGFAIGLAGEQVADHRQVEAVDLGEQQRRPAVELFHDRRNLEVRIGRRRVGGEPPLRRHALKRRAESGVEDVDIRHVVPLLRAGLRLTSCKLTRSVRMAKRMGRLARRDAVPIAGLA